MKSIHDRPYYKKVYKKDSKNLKILIGHGSKQPKHAKKGAPYTQNPQKRIFYGYEAGQAYESAQYKKYTAGKQFGDSLTISVRRQRISKKIYFGWSGNNE